MSELVAMKVGKGTLTPLDADAGQKLRALGLGLGQTIHIVVRDKRSVAMHRYLHAIAKICADNISDLEGMDAHDVIKRVQIEGDICCKVIMARLIPGMPEIPIRMPESISFKNMEEEKFRKLVGRFCDHIAQKYWPDLDAETIEKMAGVMPDLK